MDPPPRTHDFVPCQDLLGCTQARVHLCHYAEGEYGPDCNLPRDNPVHAWHTTEVVDPTAKVPGFHWSYLYCQFPKCYRGSAVKLTPDDADSTAKEWTACELHAFHRPPVKSDPHWRAPGSPRYTPDGTPA